VISSPALCCRSSVLQASPGLPPNIQPRRRSLEPPPPTPPAPPPPPAHTAAAARTARAYRAAATERAFWSAVSIEATRVEEGAAASVIAGSPLWPQGQPAQFQSLWQKMKAALHAAGQDWQVWTSWYDDRLDGRVRYEERELAYVRIEEALWDQGPAIDNAEIKKRIDEQISYIAKFEGIAEPKPRRRRKKEPKSSPLPEIPPQRPAALEPVWSNGKLVLPASPAGTDGDKRVNAAALKGLRAELVELANDVEAEPSNFDKRAAAYLRRIAERIPDRAPPQHELFRLAHAKEVLEDHGSTINDQFPTISPRASTR
jgi:hypothetical protein